VRIGEAMGEADAARRFVESQSPVSGGPVVSGDPVIDGVDDALSLPLPASIPWFEPVTRAVSDGTLTPGGPLR